MPLGDEATSRGSAPCRSRPWARTQCRRDVPPPPSDAATFRTPRPGGQRGLRLIRRLEADGRWQGRGRGLTWRGEQPRVAAGRLWAGARAPGPSHAGCSHPATRSLWKSGETRVISLEVEPKLPSASRVPAAAAVACAPALPGAGAPSRRRARGNPGLAAARVGLTRVSARRPCPTRTVPAGAQTPLTPCAHRHPGAPREGRSPACGRQGRPRCETIISGPHVLYLGADYIIFILKCYDKEPYL